MKICRKKERLRTLELEETGEGIVPISLFLHTKDFLLEKLSNLC